MPSCTAPRGLLGVLRLLASFWTLIDPNETSHLTRVLNTSHWLRAHPSLNSPWHRCPSSTRFANQTLRQFFSQCLVVSGNTLDCMRVLQCHIILTVKHTNKPKVKQVAASSKSRAGCCWASYTPRVILYKSPNLSVALGSPVLWRGPECGPSCCCPVGSHGSVLSGLPSLFLTWAFWLHTLALTVLCQGCCCSLERLPFPHRSWCRVMDSSVRFACASMFLSGSYSLDSVVPAHL